MEVSLDKEYRTVGGEKVKLFHIFPAINEHDRHRVFGAFVKELENNVWHPYSWTIEGYHSAIYPTTCHPEHNLVEVGKYDHINIDDKVWVWSHGESVSHRKKRHFAGVSDEGKPTAFMNGATSWSNDTDVIEWDHCEKCEG